MARSTRWASDVAKALVERAQADGVLIEVLRSSFVLGRALETRPSMIGDLSNPATALSERESALEKSLHGFVHEYLLNACRMLLHEQRFDQVLLFLQRIRREARDRAKTEDAILRTPDECSSATVKQLEELVTAERKRTVILHPEIDERLEAGFCIDGMDWTVDGSLRGAREKLLSTLLAS